MSLKTIKMFMKHSETYEDQRKGEAKIRKWRRLMKNRKIYHQTGSAIGTVWNAEAWIEYEKYKLHMHIQSFELYKDAEDDEIRDFKVKISSMLKAMGLQSDEVYLNIEQIMDTRIDCCIAAG